MSATTTFPEPSASQLRRVELLIFPLRTFVVIAALWLVHWMWANFSLSDVTVLYQVAIWLSIILATLSVIRTAITMRAEPGHVLLRDAKRSLNAWATLRSGQWRALVRDEQRPGLRTAALTNRQSEPAPLSKVAILRLIELLVFMAIRFGLVLAVYSGYRKGMEILDPHGSLVPVEHQLWPAAVLIAVVLFFLGNRMISVLLADESSRHLRLARRVYTLIAPSRD
ncbi:hypothetical protein G6L67_24735 [Agrobacterium tumefaciens]|uniref:Uncharacterized protein n=3 Tax=Rhizobium/Agrobacterium group TaxID=227290 RepID=A0A4V1DXD2_RHIRH|nr:MULTISPECIES: hypothetical protein [Rhizobium/Agrobacterium group]AYM84840.1 hypothetical protein At12D1_49580 [Agrobacterium tumefaciens]NTE95072.1 hypothetical protein [Agrobacterium tumefaciens]QCL10737.1 hypothetical protein pOC-C5.8_561 [Rhizobium rhizogenes]QCL98411.1 hypothetical protein CFBP7129_29985 [Agrobacterium tumefaciens]CUX68535.1 membrane hypothetical protein [Agrobacterium tumefaciens str. Kerr 14]